MSAPAATTTGVGTAPAVWRRVRGPAAIALGTLAASAALAVRSPHLPGSYGFCPLRAVTGAYCPGCGALRAVHDLLQGDLAGAWDMNPLLVVAAPVALVLWARWVWLAWRGRPVPLVSTRAAIGLGVVLALFAVARNLPALAPVLAP